MSPHVSNGTKSQGALNLETTTRQGLQWELANAGCNHPKIDEVGCHTQHTQASPEINTLGWRMNAWPKHTKWQAAAFFPRASERRVLLIVEVCHHIFSSHLLIFRSSHLTSSHLTSSHLHIFLSPHLLTSSHIFTFSHLYSIIVV